MENDYNAKISTLQKDLEDSKNRLKQMNERKLSQMQGHFEGTDDSEEQLFTLRKKLPESGADRLALIEKLEMLDHSNKSSH